MIEYDVLVIGGGFGGDECRPACRRGGRERGNGVKGLPNALPLGGRTRWHQCSARH